MSDANPQVKPVQVNKKRKSKKKKFVIFGAIFLVIIIVIAVLASSKKEKMVEVQTEKIKKRNITQLVTATGKIQAETKVVISSEVSGEIVALPFKEGEEVKKGDLVVKIKQEAYAPQIQEQNAQVKVAESTMKINEVGVQKTKLEFERIQELQKKGLASQSDLDNARLNYEQTLAQLNNNRANINLSKTGLAKIKYDISKTTIYAPMSGTVTQLNNEVGEKVLGTSFNQGTGIMTISDLSSMECQIDVSETDVALINIGDTARIQVDAFPNRVFTGYVYEIANTAKSKGTGTQEEVVNFVVKVRILDKDAELRPGMSCTCDIEVDKRNNVITVPIQSITVRDETIMNQNVLDESNENLQRKGDNKKEKKNKPQEVVFIVENGAAKKKNVKTGISDDNYIEITEGLADGEEVVKGSYKAINTELEDNSKVKVDNEVKMKKKDKE
ncbi:MAG: efflux RND transporter periplasmic adaptor subunit [Bacteroidetes bacterium]|nr:efflux RND transporter periplasmic adaptor subunit [Bacteroidota bacterium]MBX7045088.1 efflux RND transporter periplasmic adaptor subunit [Ignavibacteria bacterium]